MTKVVTLDVLDGRNFISYEVEVEVTRRIMKWLQQAAVAEGVFQSRWSREHMLHASSQFMREGKEIHAWVFRMGFYFREALESIVDAVSKLQKLQEEHNNEDEVLVVLQSQSL